MIIYEKMVIEIKVSLNEMLFLLKREIFDCLYIEKNIKSAYRLLSGKISGEYVTQEGKYKVAVTGKKRIKICLQNVQDNVIYKYNVRVKFWWKRKLQDVICEGLIDVIAKYAFEDENFS